MTTTKCFSGTQNLLRNLLFLTFFLTAIPLFSASYKITGAVADSIGNPESFATVRVFALNDTIHPIKGSVADDAGRFTVDLASPGSYRVNILAFGKTPENKDITLSEAHPNVDLGQIKVREAINLLQEVTVTAQKPLVSKEIDRIGYDVQSDPDSKTSQLDDMLKRVPLVSVDPDGTIKVKGSTDFKIYKNGRPNNSFSRNAKEIFKSIPASMIKKIEVITDPGAREDAEGTSAILNIVTMENTTVRGVMGSAGLNYRMPGYPTPNLWLSSQIDKVSFSVYAGGSIMSEKQMRGKSESMTHYNDSGNELSSSDESSGKGYLTYFGTDLSYEVDSLNLVTAEFGGYLYDFRNNSYGNTSMKDALGNLIYSYNTTSHAKPNRYLDFNGGINYQRSTRRKGESITLSYLISTTDQKQHSETDYEEILNMPVTYTGIDNIFNLNFIEHTGQIDWTRPINDYNKFDIGSKYINRRNHSVNDIDYINDHTEHSDFSHITQVLAFYADYRFNYKKFGARAGLRYEYSRLSAKYKDGSNEPFHSNLNDWVPNAAISYNINDANSLKLSYSSRINRPGISQLNPAVVESPTSISSGNPHLGSSRHQSLSLNYNFITRRLSLDVNAGYSFSNNSVTSVQNLLENDIIQHTYANAGRQRSVNLGAWMQWQATDKTSVMINMSANWRKYENRSLAISEQGWGMDIFGRIRQRLPWDVDLTVFVSEWKPGVSLYSKNTSSWSDNLFYGLDLQKSFLKEKRLSVRIGISNPFKNSARVYTSEPINAGYSGYTKGWQYNQANNLSLSISYRFGSLNVQVKKTSKSITNDDVENRRN